ncbi:MAG: type II secretion system protein, partial [Ruminococcus sp.]|nr:type II secretion system protein [Ruminococcus sp.]
MICYNINEHILRRCTRMENKKTRKGFTLVELVIVLAIIA